MRNSIFFCILFLFPGSAFALSKSIELQSQQELIAAEVLLFASPSKEPETLRESVTLVKRDNDLWTVSFHYPEELPYSYFIVIARDKEDRKIVSPVQILSYAVEENEVSWCDSIDYSFVKSLTKLSQEQMELVLELRRSKYVAMESKVKAALTDSIIKKIFAEEERLGIREKAPLSKDSSIEEILRRVSLLHAHRTKERS